jgi:threonine dehydratase
MQVTLQAIEQAAAQLEGQIIRSPCAYSQVLSRLTGAEVVVKFENLQFTASFKERGAFTKLISLTQAQRAAGVIAMSAGNHAQGVAYHAQRLGIAATIVMPRSTPNVKVENTRALGAEVILHGDTLEESAQRMQQLVGAHGYVVIHPYDDPHIIAGQGTLALEMLQDHPQLEVLILPIGGGGLAAGCAVAAKAISPGIEIIGVQAERFPAMRQTLADEEINCGPATIAEGIAVKRPGALTAEIIREQLDEIVLVSEDELERAVLLLLEVEKTVAEGAGAAGLAALCNLGERLCGRRVGLVISGGNLDMALLSSIITRGLVRSERLVRLVATISDSPGSLAGLTARLSELEANVVEVYHHRAFATVPLKSVDVELVLQTRGGEHLQQIIDGLDSAGYAVRQFVQAT